MRWILALLGAFLLGSLPWGLWLGRLLRGIDVRRQGSGNLGATNVYRVLGPGPGIAVLLLDAGKGAAAVFLARAILHAGPAAGGAAAGAAADAARAAASAPAVDWPGLAALAAAVVGHSFTPFAGFRGGKGAATAAGAWGVVAPLPLAIVMGVFTALFAIRRIVSLATISAAVALPIATGLLRPRPWADPLFWLSVVTCALILLRHRSNLSRLAAGSERPLDLKGPVREAEPAEGTTSRPTRR
jgi:acyl phosphate:glycerol-3-phosphate acyltransferase